jgi:hypothetical protein
MFHGIGSNSGALSCALLITSWHRPQRKHSSCVVVFVLLQERVYLAVAQKGPWYICPPHSRCISTALRVTIWYIIALNSTINIQTLAITRHVSSSQYSELSDPIWLLTSTQWKFLSLGYNRPKHKSTLPLLHLLSPLSFLINSLS